MTKTEKDFRLSIFGNNPVVIEDSFFYPAHLKKEEVYFPTLNRVIRDFGEENQLDVSKVIALDLMDNENRRKTFLFGKSLVTIGIEGLLTFELKSRFFFPEFRKNLKSEYESYATEYSVSGALNQRNIQMRAKIEFSRKGEFVDRKMDNLPGFTEKTWQPQEDFHYREYMEEKTKYWFITPSIN